MANTLKDLSDGDILRKSLKIFHQKSKFLKTIDRQYDNRFPGSGVKNGGSILIRNPNEFTVRSGATMNVNDVTETTQTMTVATQRGVDMPAFSTLEQTMQIEDFENRYLVPAVSRLVAECESMVISDVYKDVFNLTGTPATTPASLLAIRKAQARLSQNLAPDEDRSLIMNSDAMINTLDAFNTYFHKSNDIERIFSEGKLGHAAGFDWYESNMVPNHTNGTRTDTTPVVNTSTGITSGSDTITMTAFADGTTYKQGDIFTIADVYAVNRETKQRYSHLQQFVVTADETETGSGDMSPTVSPTPVTSGAKQNVDLESAGAGKAVVNLTGGGSGAASLVSTQNMAYHKNAFAVAFADLYTDPGERMEQRTIEGVPMRIWHGSDITNDKFYTRIDVVLGWKTLRPEWANRVRG